MCVLQVQTTKKQLIDADTAIEFKYTAGMKSRGQQAMRNKLGSEHATVSEIRCTVQQKYEKHCPKAFFPGNIPDCISFLACCCSVQLPVPAAVSCCEHRR